MVKNRMSNRRRALKLARQIYGVLSGPLAIVMLTYSRQVHGSYNMGWLRRMCLGFRFWYNFSRMTSGTNWRAHLVIAMRLLEIPPEVKGCVIECGCWKGGATVNLSRICAAVGRELKIYDSFEGLPPPKPGDLIAERSFSKGFVAGVFGGALEEVQANVAKFGAPEVCTYHKGWFEETLPSHEGDIVLAFWDVDHYSSLHDCLQHLWPHIVEKGYLFMDEYREVEYCSVFYSEKYWEKYFACAPPGLIGIGTGVQVGMFYTDPSIGFGSLGLLYADSIGYTQKGVRRCIWEYYPDESSESDQAQAS